jgi:hypothetical protein
MSDETQNETNHNKLHRQTSSKLSMKTALKRIEEEDDASLEDSIYIDKPFKPQSEEGVMSGSEKISEKPEKVDKNDKIERLTGTRGLFGITKNNRSSFASSLDIGGDVNKRSFTTTGRPRKLSFWNGRPKTEAAIDQLVDPFYTCEKTVYQTTVVERGLHQGRVDRSDTHVINTFELKTFKSMFMTIMQIINSIIRYTIVQFPFCIRILGLIYGPLIICLIGVMSIFSIYMLIEVKGATSKK